VIISKLRLIMFAAMLPAVVLAQVNGSINGTVTDASQASIPGANLVLKNTQTGETRNTTSGEDGFFTFIDLPRGEYDIRVTAQGFRELQLGPLVLTVGQQMTVRPRLEIGSVTENRGGARDPTAGCHVEQLGFATGGQQEDRAASVERP
jgi:hypothetical protein